MHIQPTNDLLLVRRNNPEDVRTDSGIILPPVEESLETPYTGIVIGCGPGKLAKLAPAAREVVDALQALVDAFRAMPNVQWESRGIGLNTWQRAIDALEIHKDGNGRLPMTVKAGNTIVFSKHGLQKFRIDGEDLIALQEASALGVLE